MQDVELFSQLLGLVKPWKLKEIKSDIPGKKITLSIEYPECHKGICPVCKNECSIYDRNDLKKWRHLDTMQFETIIECRVPRINCKDDGVKTMDVPWAGKRSQFTLLFERFAIEVILHSATQKSAMEILRLSWDEVHHLQERAVKRGLEKREEVEFKRIGIDEKSFLKGHNYASIMHDVDSAKVIDVVQGRDENSVKKLFDSLSEVQKNSIEAVAMDMWQPYMSVADFVLPNADIVHDKFHVAGYLSKAVDKVRKQEHRELMNQNDDSLKRTKYLWLKDINNFNSDEKWLFNILKQMNLDVGRAWAIKESFRHFWAYKSETWADKFFKEWFFWSTHSKLEPIIDAAYTLKRHYEGIKNYIKHRITNSKAEGLNSKIQAIKSAARGFRNFSNFRIAILFHCGGLALYP